MDTIQNITTLTTNPIDWWLMLKLIILLSCGILIYTFYKAKKYVKDNTFTFKKFREDNWKKWLWAFCLGSIVEVLVVTVPDIDYLFSQFFGIDVTNSVAGAVFLGIGLIGLVNNETKDK